MDSFNVGKDGQPPRQPGQPPQMPVAPKQQKEDFLTPADRARKGLFSKKEKPPQAGAGKHPPQGRPAARAAAPKAAAGDSSKSKVILLIILGIVVIGAGGIFVYNSFSNKPPEFPMQANASRRVFLDAGTAARPGLPQPPSGQPVTGAPAAQPAGAEKNTIPPIVQKQTTPAASQPATAQAAPAKPATAAQQPPAKQKAPEAAAKKPAAQKQPAAKAAKFAAKKQAAPAVSAPKTRAVPKPAAKPVAVSPKTTTPAASAKKPVYRQKSHPAVTARRQQPKSGYAAPSGKSYRKVQAPATVQIVALPRGGYAGGTAHARGTVKENFTRTADVLYDWPGGQSKGKSKNLFQEQPESEVVRQEREKMMDEFASVEKLYMVLIKESADPEELRDYGRLMPHTTPPLEIKQTTSHGRQVYWLTVGHYTTVDKAYNKSQELKSMGVETTVVSEKIYY